MTDEFIKNDTPYGARPKSVEYWSQNRQHFSDLYDSEKHFLESAFKISHSVLDVGCAAGGGFSIAKDVNPNIEYTGIDVGLNLIQTAQKKYPAGKFLHYDGTRIPFDDSSFDLVFSLGVVHHIKAWPEFVLEMLRATKKNLVFDMRLTTRPTLSDEARSFQKIAFDEKWDGESIVPYVIVNDLEVKGFLENLVFEQGLNIATYGYWGKPTSLAVTEYDEAFMMSISLLRDASEPGLDFALKS